MQPRISRVELVSASVWNAHLLESLFLFFSGTSRNMWTSQVYRYSTYGNTKTLDCPTFLLLTRPETRHNGSWQQRVHECDPGLIPLPTGAPGGICSRDHAPCTYFLRAVKMHSNHLAILYPLCSRGELFSSPLHFPAGCATVGLTQSPCSSGLLPTLRRLWLTNPYSYRPGACTP